MNTSLSLKLLLSLSLMLSASAPAFAARDGQDGRAERRAERRAEQPQRQANQQQQQDFQRQQRDQQRDQQRALNQQRDQQRDQQRAMEQRQRDQQRDQQRAMDLRQRDQQRDQQRAMEQAQRDQQKNQQRAMEQAQRDQQRAENKARKAATNVYVPQPRDDKRWDNRTSNGRWNDRDNHWDNRNDRDRGHWDQRWYERNRQQAALDRRFRNWNDQRDYLKANLRKFNQIAKLNALQQQQLNQQMQAAYLAYHNNNWNGGYNWDYYSEPQFLDYLQANQPSLLDRILGYLGMGPLSGGYGGYGYGNGYLYSSDWGVERDQLAQNMYRIHQLALEGRITPLQEQQLLAQMRGSFAAYHNNNWNGGYGWSQYSDPGFVDYLNNSQPGILTTIRSYLGM